VLARYATAMIDGLTLLWLNEPADEGHARAALDLAMRQLLDQAVPNKKAASA
jgi:hypothetical protein